MVFLTTGASSQVWKPSQDGQGLQLVKFNYDTVEISEVNCDSCHQLINWIFKCLLTFVKSVCKGWGLPFNQFGFYNGNFCIFKIPRGKMLSDLEGVLSDLRTLNFDLKYHD